VPTQNWASDLKLFSYVRETVYLSLAKTPSDAKLGCCNIVTATLLAEGQVLFPKERVRSDFEQTIFVVLAQRSKLDQLAREQRLQIERHCCGIIAEFQPPAMCAENVHVAHIWDRAVFPA